MSDGPDTIDHEAFEARCRAGIEAWVAEHLGGDIVDMVRLERWRPQWKVTYTAAGEDGAVLVWPWDARDVAPKREKLRAALHASDAAAA